MQSLFRNRQPLPFRDRIDAGHQLADRLRPHLEQVTPEDIVAIGLARGGVIVAGEVARQLDIRLEAIVVRKLGTPGQPELALGALVASGHQTFNRPLIEDIGIGQEELHRVIESADEAARALCNEIGAPAAVPDIAGKTAILVDDGMATGATMRVAIKAVRSQGAERVIVALPVAPATAQKSLEEIADDVVILIAPEQLRAVGQWFQAFGDVPSSIVRDTLQANPYRKRHEH